ncbi:MAG: TonB-dependent receptor [Myxococcales bacterium]|nr:TonB-dependent receptor [Myxococcales bacterium]
MSHAPRTLTAALTLALAAPAIAQDAPEGTEATQAPEGTEATDQAPAAGGMEEIIVTATRTRENLQRVPASVATLADDQLDALTAAGVDIRFLAARVPSLNAESSFGRTFPRFYIRGLGNTDFDLNASQPVSLVYDDVVLENPILKAFPAFDLDRVEVLRGPQGTLFGRNTPAGTIKLESKRPTDELDAYASVAYGSFNLVETEGALGGPLVDDLLAGRLSLLYQRRDDSVDNTLTDADADLEGFDDLAARAQLLLTLGDFEALLNIHARRLRGTARVFRANAIAPGGGLADGFDRYAVSQDGQNEQTLDSLGGALTLTQELGRLTLTSITAYETAETYSRGDIDGGYGAAFLPDLPMGPGVIPFPSETADAVPALGQFTEELRLTGQELGPFGFVVGAYFFHEDLDIQSFSYDSLAPGNPQNGYATQSQQTLALAGFGSLSYRPVEAIELRAGARYAHEQKDFTARRDTSPVGAGALTEQTVELDDDFLSADASLTWFAAEDINLYARVARGFRAPSIQGRVLFGDVISTADSEKILSYEAGLKTRLFQGQLRANLSGFYYTLTDQQLTAVGGAQNFNTLINADATHGYGFELDLSSAPLAGLFLTAGLSLNRTAIDDPGLSVVGGAAQGITFRDPVADADAGTYVIDGNSLPLAPEWIANLTARYGLPVRGDDEVFAFVDLAWRSEIRFFLYDSEEFRSDGLLEVGARLGYTWQIDDDTALEAAAYGRNLLDQTEFEGGIDFNNLTGFLNEPRTFGAELTARF